MKTIALVFLVAGATLAGAVATLAVLAVISNRELRNESLLLRTELEQARGELTRLRRDHTDVAADLTAARTELESVKSELEKSKEDAATPPVAGVPKASRVRAFLGNQYIGLAWLVPSPGAKDPETGKIAYEPIMVLEEPMRQSLTVSKTNVVEREAPRQLTVNYNYPYTYPWTYWWYPVTFFNQSTNCVPCNPFPTTLVQRMGPSVITPTSAANPFGNTKLFMPSGKLFLPPIGKNRPPPL